MEKSTKLFCLAKNRIIFLHSVEKLNYFSQIYHKIDSIKIDYIKIGSIKMLTVSQNWLFPISPKKPNCSSAATNPNRPIFRTLRLPQSSLWDYDCLGKHLDWSWSWFSILGQSGAHLESFSIGIGCCPNRR